MILKIVVGLVLAYALYIVIWFIASFLLTPWLMNAFNGVGYFQNLLALIGLDHRYSEYRMLRSKNEWERSYALKMRALRKRNDLSRY